MELEWYLFEFWVFFFLHFITATHFSDKLFEKLHEIITKWIISRLNNLLFGSDERQHLIRRFWEVGVYIPLIAYFIMHKSSMCEYFKIRGKSFQTKTLNILYYKWKLLGCHMWFSNLVISLKFYVMCYTKSEWINCSSNL